LEAASLNPAASYGFVDIHSHILPGVDDGARDLEDSIDIARNALADGISVMVATPHVRYDYPTTPTAMEERLEVLRERLRSEGLALQVLPGGEIAIDSLAGLSTEDLLRLTLGGGHRYLLVEFPYFGWPLSLGAEIVRLHSQGFRAVLAHPERNPEVQRDPKRLATYVESGALVQVTAASFDGRLGRPSAKTTSALMKLGLLHAIASDAHSSRVRGVGISNAVRQVADAPLARWLTYDVPRAIVLGESPPDRPAPERRRKVRFL
jgi:protein-tyrosine phosphatase